MMVITLPYTQAPIRPGSSMVRHHQLHTIYVCKWLGMDQEMTDARSLLVQSNEEEDGNALDCIYSATEVFLLLKTLLQCWSQILVPASVMPNRVLHEAFVLSSTFRVTIHTQYTRYLLCASLGGMITIGSIGPFFLFRNAIRRVLVRLQSISAPRHSATISWTDLFSYASLYNAACWGLLLLTIPSLHTAQFPLRSVGYTTSLRPHRAHSTKSSTTLR